MARFHGHKRMIARKGAHRRRGAGWFSDALGEIPLVGTYIKDKADEIYNKKFPGKNEYFGDETLVGKLGRPIASAAVKAGLTSALGPAGYMAATKADDYIKRAASSKKELEQIIEDPRQLAKRVVLPKSAARPRRGGWDLGRWASNTANDFGITPYTQHVIANGAVGAYNGLKEGDGSHHHKRGRRGGWDFGRWARNVGNDMGISDSAQNTIAHGAVGLYKGVTDGDGSHHHKRGRRGGWDFGRWARNVGNDMGISDSAQNTIARGAVGAYKGVTDGDGSHHRRHGGWSFPSEWEHALSGNPESMHASIPGGMDGIEGIHGGHYGDIGGGSRWHHHVKKFRAAHPHLSFKEALQEAKHSYK